MTTTDLQRAAQAYRDAYDERNRAIARALAQGWTQRAVADAVGLSKGRLGQLAKELGTFERTFRPKDV